MLAYVLVSKKPEQVATRWHSDLSGLPFSARRAYGRVTDRPFVCRQASIKALKPILSVDAQGRVVSKTQVYGLTLQGEKDVSVIVYFTRKNNESIQRMTYRRRPNDKIEKSSIPIGVTSVQYVTTDPTSGKTNSQTYRHSFSARLFLGSQTDSRITGSIVTVFPDSRRSFVCGSFKAQVVSSSI